MLIKISSSEQLRSELTQIKVRPSVADYPFMRFALLNVITALPPVTLHSLIC